MILNGLIENDNQKPGRPKEAMEIVLRTTKKPRSSAIYYQIAQNVSLEGHKDLAFVKFKNLLNTWFREE